MNPFTQLVKSLDNEENELLQDVLVSLKSAMVDASGEECREHAAAFLIFLSVFMPDALGELEVSEKQHAKWQQHLKDLMAREGKLYYGPLEKHYYGVMGTGPGKMDVRGYGPTGAANPRKSVHSTSKKQRVHGRGGGMRTLQEKFAGLARMFEARMQVEQGGLKAGDSDLTQGQKQYLALSDEDKQTLTDLEAHMDKKGLKIPTRAELDEMGHHTAAPLASQLGILSETRGGEMNVVDQDADGNLMRRYRDVADHASEASRGAGENLGQGNNSGAKSALDSFRTNKKRGTIGALMDPERRLGTISRHDTTNHKSPRSPQKHRIAAEEQKMHEAAGMVPGTRGYGPLDTDGSLGDQPSMTEQKAKYQKKKQQEKQKEKLKQDPKKTLQELLDGVGRMSPGDVASLTGKKVNEGELVVSAGQGDPGTPPTPEKIKKFAQAELDKLGSAYDADSFGQDLDVGDKTGSAQLKEAAATEMKRAMWSKISTTGQYPSKEEREELSDKVFGRLEGVGEESSIKNPTSSINAGMKQGEKEVSESLKGFMTATTQAEPAAAEDILEKLNAPDPQLLSDVMDRIDELFESGDYDNVHDMEEMIYSKVYNTVGEPKPATISQEEYAAALLGGKDPSRTAYTRGYWHHRTGEAGGMSGVESKDMRRFYFNALPDNAPKVTNDLQQALDKAGVKFQYKTIASVKNFNRSDSAVLYIQKGDSEEVARIVAEVVAKNEGAFADGVPKLTRQIMPGVAVADEPDQDEFRRRYIGGQVSFGSGSARVIANALEGGADMTKDERMAAVRAEYATMGLDPDRPWLNDGASTAAGQEPEEAENAGPDPKVWDDIPTAAKKIADDIEKKRADGNPVGGTYRGTNLAPSKETTGYFVSEKGAETILDPENPAFANRGLDKTLEIYLQMARGKVQQHNLGIWEKDGKVYVDVSRHFDSKAEALKFAADNNQAAIWDVAEGAEVTAPVKPTPGEERFREEARANREAQARSFGAFERESVLGMTTTSRSAKTIDKQQYELYRAEFAMWPGDPESARVLTSAKDSPKERVAKLQAEVDSIQDTEYWRRTYPSALRVTVALGGPVSGANASRFDGTMRVSVDRKFHTGGIILHEMIHTVLSSDRQGHGPEYAKNHLEAVRAIRGEEAAAALEQSYKKNKVEVASGPAGSNAPKTRASKKKVAELLARQFTARDRLGVALGTDEAKAAQARYTADPEKWLRLAVDPARAGQLHEELQSITDQLSRVGGRVASTGPASKPSKDLLGSKEDKLGRLEEASKDVAALRAKAARLTREGKELPRAFAMQMTRAKTRVKRIETNLKDQHRVPASELADVSRGVKASTGKRALKDSLTEIYSKQGELAASRAREAMNSDTPFEPGQELLALRAEKLRVISLLRDKYGFTERDIRNLREGVRNTSSKAELARTERKLQEISDRNNGKDGK